MSFYHDELVGVGFNPSDLFQLSLVTTDHMVKFRVMWDENNEPHFHYEKGHSHIKEVASTTGFYHDFVSWSYNKTRIQSYRVIHFRNRVSLLFGHIQDSVNPTHQFPEYDFSGFTPYFKKFQDGSSSLRWNIATQRDDVPENLLNPAGFNNPAL